MRTRVVSVRFSDSEYARIGALRDASPVVDDRGRQRKSLALWCRAAVTRSILLDDLRPGLPVVASSDLHRMVVACRKLNDVTRLANVDMQVTITTLSSLELVGRLVTQLLPEVEDQTSTVERERSDHLVNIRVSDDDLAMWKHATRQAGFTRVSSWVTDVLLGIAGYVRTRRADASVVELRRQLAGAINNAAQLQVVAECSDRESVDAIERSGVTLIEMMAAWNLLGRSGR